MEGTVAPLINFDCVDELESNCEVHPIGLLDDLEKAKDYLADFHWVLSIEEKYLGGFFPEIVGIFLFKISPKSIGVDDYVWVVVGDIPSAYITVEDSPNPATALDAYIGAMEEWVEAVLNSESTSGLIPVGEPATKEYALVLKRRLKYLEDRILPDCRGSLEENRGQ